MSKQNRKVVLRREMKIGYNVKGKKPGTGKGCRRGAENGSGIKGVPSCAYEIGDCVVDGRVASLSAAALTAKNNGLLAYWRSADLDGRKQTLLAKNKAAWLFPCPGIPSPIRRWRTFCVWLRAKETSSRVPSVQVRRNQ